MERMGYREWWLEIEKWVKRIVSNLGKIKWSLEIR